ncbi:TPA: hypothetical protein EYO57_36565 [Candidatus Poribacteria bacterium]|nr:hypothetical protein [Candidatus Poribacteria bacterium]
MSFLNPLILAALPLMALPILIHLINQHRHRTVQWAAMMFLVSAKRMHKGMARLRYLLIMLMRIAAIGAMILAFSRPLASGWMSGVGMGKPDATLILLDRSASMETQDIQTGESKRSTALKKLAELLEKRDYGSQLILIDSANGEAHSIESPKALIGLPITEATATSANIPGMLETALAYLKANKSGRADIWICSDLNENDWAPNSGRWAAILEQFSQLKGVHHFLLSYTDQPSNNLSIRVANVKRRQIGNRDELILDVLLRAENQQAQTSNVARRIPIEFEVNNVRSVIDVELDAQGASLQGHRIPIDSKLRSGWGSVALPSDSNPLDNRFYFVFSEPPVRKAIIVTDDPKTGKAFRRGLGIPTESHLQHSAEIIPLSRVVEIDWKSTGLLIWQAPLPSGLLAKQIESFVNSGRVVMFFPPAQSGSEKLFNLSWGNWQKPEQEQGKVAWWRGNADLLAHVGSGDPLPLNELRTYRYRTIESLKAENPGTPLARLGDDKPLLVRVATDRGGVYFCSTLPTAQFSSLERDGVVFYVMLQRALAEASRSLSPASLHDAAPGVLADHTQWKLVAPIENAPSISQRGLHAGVYQNEGYWAAVNRSLAEDHSEVTPVGTVDKLFDGLPYQRIDDSVGDTSSLANEIWRIFLIAMVLAMILEAALCMPEKKVEQQRFSEFSMASDNMKQESL